MYTKCSKKIYERKSKAEKIGFNRRRKEKKKYLKQIDVVLECEFVKFCMCHLC